MPGLKRARPPSPSTSPSLSPPLRVSRRLVGPKIQSKVAELGLGNLLPSLHTYRDQEGSSSDTDVTSSDVELGTSLSALEDQVEEGEADSDDDVEASLAQTPSSPIQAWMSSRKGKAVDPREYGVWRGVQADSKRPIRPPSKTLVKPYLPRRRGDRRAERRMPSSLQLRDPRRIVSPTESIRTITRCIDSLATSSASDAEADDEKDEQAVSSSLLDVTEVPSSPPQVTTTPRPARRHIQLTSDSDSELSSPLALKSRKDSARKRRERMRLSKALKDANHPRWDAINSDASRPEVFKTLERMAAKIGHRLVPASPSGSERDEQQISSELFNSSPPGAGSSSAVDFMSSFSSPSGFPAPVAVVAFRDETPTKSSSTTTTPTARHSAWSNVTPVAEPMKRSRTPPSPTPAKRHRPYLAAAPTLLEPVVVDEPVNDSDVSMASVSDGEPSPVPFFMSITPASYLHQAIPKRRAGRAEPLVRETRERYARFLPKSTNQRDRKEAIDAKRHLREVPASNLAGNAKKRLHRCTPTSLIPSRVRLRRPVPPTLPKNHSTFTGSWFKAEDVPKPTPMMGLSYIKSLVARHTSDRIRRALLQRFRERTSSPPSTREATPSSVSSGSARRRAGSYTDDETVEALFPDDDDMMDWECVDDELEDGSNKRSISSCGSEAVARQARRGHLRVAELAAILEGHRVQSREQQQAKRVARERAAEEARAYCENHLTQRAAEEAAHISVAVAAEQQAAQEATLRRVAAEEARAAQEAALQAIAERDTQERLRRERALAAARASRSSRALRSSPEAEAHAESSAAALMRSEAAESSTCSRTRRRSDAADEPPRTRLRLDRTRTRAMTTPPRTLEPEPVPAPKPLVPRRRRVRATTTPPRTIVAEAETSSSQAVAQVPELPAAPSLAPAIELAEPSLPASPTEDAQPETSEPTTEAAEITVESLLGSPPAYEYPFYPVVRPALPTHLRRLVDSPPRPTEAEPATPPRYARMDYSRNSPSPPPPYNAATDCEVVLPAVFLADPGEAPSTPPRREVRSAPRRRRAYATPSPPSSPALAEIEDAEDAVEYTPQREEAPSALGAIARWLGW